MLSRAALLVCLCVGAEGSNAGIQKIPQFYTSSDCTGAIDAESKTWSVEALDGVAVTPFATEGEYMESWVFNKCVGGTRNSVRLTIDGTACTTDNAENQFVLNYYAGSAECGTAAATTPLTAGTCVAYGRGSVKLVTEITLDDMCALTNYVTALYAGGVKWQAWLGSSCSGSSYLAVNLTESNKACGAQPACDGCCTSYDTSCQPESVWDFNLQACTRGGDSWKLGMKFRSYSNSECTTPVHSEMSAYKGLHEEGVCSTFEVNGSEGAVKVSLIPPMSVNVYCESLEVRRKYNMDPSVVSWADLIHTADDTVTATMPVGNITVSDAGEAAMPHILAILAFVFAALL